MDQIAPQGRQKMKAECSGGVIVSDKVLMATNAFNSQLRKLRQSIIPVWDYQLATEPLTELQLESIGWHKTRHALSNDANMFHYYL
jgi:glycine/D-amino acid oxidase-like deaminating enzyme